MDKSKYSAVLEQLGLNPQESKIYIYLLKESKSLAKDIAKSTEISRTNTYNILKQLESRSLIRKIDDKGKTYFALRHPENLYSVLDKESKRINTAKNILNAVIGDLDSDFQLSQEIPSVFRFEGMDGVKKVYSELQRERLLINSIMDRESLVQGLGEFNNEWREIRKKLKLKARVICERNEKIQTDDNNDLREVRYIPKGIVNNFDFKITEKRMVVSTFKKESSVGIVIIEPEVISNFLNIFNYIWDNIASVD